MREVAGLRAPRGCAGNDFCAHKGTRFAIDCLMHTSAPRPEMSQVSPSDIQVRNGIQEQMHRQGGVDATKIGIVVRGGQVLLWGSVASEHERTLAGQIAAQLAADRAVINHIRAISQS